MSMFSKAFGGGGGLLAAAINPFAAIQGSLFSGLGGSLFPGAPQVPGVNIPQFNQGDQQALQDLTGQQNQLYGNQMDQTKSLYGDTFNKQNDIMSQLIDQSRGNFMSDLSTGTGGEEFRQKYNNLGLLNSGAFNQGLANAFAPVEAESEQAMMGQRMNQQQELLAALSGIMGNQTQNQVDLGQAGLQRRYGLEDAQTNAILGRDTANAQLKQQYRQGNQGLLGGLLGGGMSLLGGMK